MKKPVKIKTLFLDIGGVLLTDGWDHHARRRAANKFKLKFAEMNSRHLLNFETFEQGKLTMEKYLDRVVFYQKRTFTRVRFRNFMFAQSKPYPGMIRLILGIKARYSLKIVVVSNEARELNAYRIQKFRLDRLADSFISSCFVGIRKPDPDIFRLALDSSQTPARAVVYLENTPLFVQVAEGFGVRGILHRDYESTRKKLASLGLRLDGELIHESN
jgi:putative hydrolase of the HAD superfamily